MSRPTKAKRTPKKIADFSSTNLNFSAKEQVLINDWIEDREINSVDWLITTTEAGWKISFSYSDFFEVYFMSLTAKETKTKYDGKVFILRHLELTKLFYIAAYVISEWVPNDHPDLSGGLADVDW